MKSSTVSRSYAEVIFTLAEKSGRLEEYAGLLDALSAAVDSSAEAQAVLMSPKVTKTRKADLLAASLPGAAAEFLHFLKALVKRGRILFLGQIAIEYQALLDQKHNRVRANITLARAADPALQAAVAQALGKALGKEVVPRFSVDPEILGGAIIRVEDRVLDGSVRRKLAQLRRQLLAK